MKLGELVEVVWWDAVGPVDDDGDELEPAVVKTVGYVTSDMATTATCCSYITVAAEDAGYWRARTTIPRSCIISVQTLGGLI